MARQPRSRRTGHHGIVPLAFRLAGAVRREFSSRMADESWAAEADLRPGCYGLLRVVAEADGALSQREVAAAMSIAPSDAVDLIDRLERAGLVRRERDPADRRRNVLALAPPGHQAMDRFGAVARSVDEAVLAPLTERERETLLALLQRVVGDDPARSARAPLAAG